MTPFSRQALAPPVEATFTHARRVRFQDVDAAGIIFFPRVLEYFHDAYVAWLEARGIPFAEAINTRRWGAPIRHVDVSFLRPMRFGDDVAVEIIGGVVEPTQAWLGHRILGAGHLLAFGTTRHVFVDMHAFKRAEMPPDVRAVFESLPRLSTDQGSP